MNQTSKQLTKIDYLTVVFCPDEIARLRFDAKIAFGKGDFGSYKEAYNAMLCAELFDQQATDDLDVEVNESVVYDSDYYYDQLFENNPRYRNYGSVDAIPSEERAHFFKNVVRKTKRYKTLNSLIEGDITKFMHLLNTEVATAADRLTSDDLSWSYRHNSGGMFTYEKSATLYRHDVNSGVVAWGANNGGVMISFSGAGCAGLDIPKLHA
ncbi:hypothetical protein L1272_08190, partial [Pseudoalteromonas sp. PAST1]|nr:hypothetical protein [Pseudoalteromonas sp. PAST1]